MNARHVVVRTLRWFALGLGGGVLLVLLALGGFLGFLRTESGERWVKDTLVSSLNGAGMEASLGELRGPLPNHLLLRDLVLSDRRGVWLKVPEASLSLDLAALLRWKFVVRKFALLCPELLRVPELPPSPEPEPPSDPSDPLAFTRGLPGWLPAIEIQDLLLQDVVLGAQVPGGPLAASLQGSAATGPDKVFGARLHVKAGADPRQMKDTLDLRAELYGDRNLNLQLHFAEKPGGLLERMGLPGTPSFELSGAAPLETWTGEMRAGLSGALEINGRLELNLQRESRRIAVELRALPLAQARASWLPALGKELDLRLALLLSNGLAELENLDARTSAWRVEAHNLGLRDQTGASPSLSGRLTAEIMRPEELSNLAELPFASLFLELNAGGTLAAPALDLELKARELAVALPAGETATWTQGSVSPDLRALFNLSGDFQPGQPGKPESLTFALDGTVNVDKADWLPHKSMETRINLVGERAGEMLTVRRLHIESPFLQADGEGGWNPETRDASGRLGLRVPDLAALAPLTGVPGLAGHVALDADVSGDKETMVRGAVKLALEDMRWGVAQLDDLLGASVRLGFKLKGNVPPGDTAESGNPGSVQRARSSGAPLPDVRISELRLEAAQILATGQATLERGQLSSFLDLDLRDLGAVESALSGSLQVRLRGHGPLDAPELTVDLTSPELAAGGERLRNLELRAHTPAFVLSGNPPSGVPQASGTLRLSADLDGKEQRLAARWAVDGRKANLEGLQALLAGIELSGNLETVFAGPSLKGSLTARVADWSALSRLAAISGSAAMLKVRFEPAPAGQTLTADVSASELHFGGDAAIRGLKGRAEIADVFREPRLTFTMSTKNGSAGPLSWKDSRVLVRGTPQKARLEADLNGKSSGRLRAVWADETLSLAQLRFQDAGSGMGLALARPARLELKSGFAARNVELRLSPAGNIVLNGSLNSRGLHFTARLHSVPIGLLRKFTDAPVPDGVLEATASLSGTPQRPGGAFTLNLDKVAYPGSSLPPASLAVKGAVEHGRGGSALNVELRAGGLDARDAKGHASLPLAFSADGLPSLSFSRPFNAALRWEGPLAPLWRFVPLADRRLNGQGSLEADISGTLNVPRIKAAARVRGAQYDDLVLGIMLTGINLDADLQPSGASTLSLKAGDGQGGTLSLDGTLGSPADGLPVRAKGSLKDLRPLRRNDLRISLSGDLEAAGPLFSPRVKAAITVNEGELLLAQLPGGGITVLNVVNVNTTGAKQNVAAGAAVPVVPPEQAPPLPVPPGTLDVTVTVPNRFFVRGRGIESEWRGKLSITGPFDHLSLEGQLSSVRGSMALLGKEFQLTKGVLSFEGGVMPFLDVVLTYNSPSITAEANISGLAIRPRLVLSSQPVLPQDEIVSRVLFGRSAASLSRIQALQVASALGSLTGLGNGDLGFMDMTRDLLGVDVLRFGSADPQRQNERRGDPFSGPSGAGTDNGDEETATTLEVGKYVMDNVYVGLEQGMGADTGGVRVEVELGPHTNLDAKTTDQASEVGINWKWDY